MTPEPTTSPRYASVPHQIDLPAMEHEVLELWRHHDTFTKSWERTQDGPRWTFYEGPPTANGMPGTHHIEGGWLPNWVGQNQTRAFQLSGDSLSLDADSAAWHAHLTWKRIP